MLLRIVYFYMFRSNMDLVGIRPLINEWVYIWLDKFFEKGIVFPYNFLIQKCKKFLMDFGFYSKHSILRNYVLKIQLMFRVFIKFIKDEKVLSNMYYYYVDFFKVVVLGKNISLFLYNNNNEVFMHKYLYSFITVIQWEIDLMLSLNSLNKIYNSIYFYKDLSIENSLMFFVMENKLSYIIDNVINKDLNKYGLVTSFIFNKFYKLSHNHSQLLNNNSYFYSTFNFYKFYNVDMYRVSFLFFENVRHSTKLEILWTVIPTLILVLIALHLLPYYIHMMSL